MSTLHSKKYRRPSITNSRTGQDYITYSKKNCLLKHVIEGKIEGRIKAAGR
jgi:hypothetical protein